MSTFTLKRITALFLVIALCLGCCACGNKEEEPVNEAPEENVTQPEENITEPEENNTTEEIPEEPEEPKIYHPLTGIELEEDVSSVRPFGVMINNIVTAIPQWGISKADIIYEVPVEGGITRFFALFSDPYSADIIGSVRSARPYYIDLVQSYDAIYVHAGGSAEAMDKIHKNKINNIDGVNGSGETFFRDPWRKQHMGLEHSLMWDTKEVKAYVEKKNIRTEWDENYRDILDFTDEPLAGINDVQKVKEFAVNVTRSKKTTFTYNEETKMYDVHQHKRELEDEGLKTTFTPKNVLCLSMDMWNTGDKSGHLGGTFTGTGEGTFYCEGKCVPIKWSKADAKTPYSYTLADGTPLQLGRGQTFICIVPPKMGSIKITDPAQ